jgi:hypothetical protein
MCAHNHNTTDYSLLQIMYCVSTPDSRIIHIPYLRQYWPKNALNTCHPRVQAVRTRFSAGSIGRSRHVTGWSLVPCMKLPTFSAIVVPVQCLCSCFESVAVNDVQNAVSRLQCVITDFSLSNLGTMLLNKQTVVWTDCLILFWIFFLIRNEMNSINYVCLTWTLQLIKQSTIIP